MCPFLDRVQREKDALEFTKLLVEVANIYKEDDEGYIKNRDGFYLGALWKSNAKKFKIYRPHMISGVFSLFHPLYAAPLRESSVQNWVCRHIERVCAHITKRIIWIILQGIRYNDREIKEKYNGILLAENYSHEYIIEVLDEIYELPDESLILLKYDKTTKAASIVSKFLLKETRTKYPLIKPGTWNILETVFKEIFFKNCNALPLSPLIEHYVGKSAENKKLEAKLYVLIKILEKLEEWTLKFLRYELNAKALNKHISLFDEYIKAMLWQIPMEGKSIVLIDANDMNYPEESGNSFFYQDMTPPCQEIQLIAPVIEKLFPIRGFNSTLQFPRKEKMFVAYPYIIQNNLIRMQLAQNCLQVEPLNFDNLDSYMANVLSAQGYLRDRNYGEEKQCLILSKVTINLMMTLENPKELQKWLPGMTVNGAHLAYKGRAINLDEHLYNNAAIQETYSKYNYVATQFIPITYNVDKFLLLYADINGYTDPSGALDCNLALNALVNKFGINRNNIYDPIVPDDSSTWQASDDVNIFYTQQPLQCRCNSIIFYSGNGAPCYYVLRFENGTNTLLLPVTNWLRKNENPVSFFVMPPRDKLPLLNLNYITQYSSAHIIITSDLELAYKYGTKYAAENGVIWTSWYGKEAAIDRVDWTALKGRTVSFLCRDIELKEEIAITLKVLEEVEKFSESFLYIFGKDSSGTVKNYKHEDFISLAERKKVYIPEELKYKTEGRIDVNRTEKHTPDYIIEPIIEAGTLTMIYAPTGLGKTWLALSIAKAVANGENVFDGWKNVSKPKGVVYLAGEMTKEQIEDRLTDINKIYKKSDNENLLARRLDKIDLGKPESQQRVDRIMKTFSNENNIKISLLVLDNLNTLAASATFTEGWNAFLEWIKSKKEMTTIIIHHPNKEGKYLGTSNIANKVDLMIYAGEKDDMIIKLAKIFKDEDIDIQELLRPLVSNEIAMFVSPAKQRLNSKDSLRPFWLSLVNTQRDSVGWQVNYPVYDKLLEEHGYSLAALSEILRNEYLNDNFNPKDYKKQSVSNSGVYGEEIPSGMEFIKRRQDEQARIIKRLYFSGTNGKMTSEAMAKKLKISKRTLDKIRNKTKTLEKDLKNGVESEDAQKKQDG